MDVCRVRFSPVLNKFGIMNLTAPIVLSSVHRNTLKMLLFVVVINTPYSHLVGLSTAQLKSDLAKQVALVLPQVLWLLYLFALGYVCALH
jgi:hypothetical protein